MEGSAMVGARTLSGRGSVPVLRRALAEDAPFLAVVIGYALTAAILSATTGLPASLSFSFALSTWKLVGVSTALFAATLFLGFLVHEVVGLHHSLYERTTWARVLKRTFPRYKTLNYAFIFLALPTFSRVFASFKTAIVEHVPFGPWDVRFFEWDRLLHFGLDPWTLFQPLLGYPLVTKGLDVVYYTWFPVLWMTLVWQAWHGSRETQIRSQFLLSFALCWVCLGTVAATALSSAGPVYFVNVVGGPDPYAGLMDYLAGVDAQYTLKALWAQDVLWSSFVSTDPDTQYLGISAMPSLHVATAALLGIFGFSIDRRVGWLYTVYAVLIFLGSFHLAWHYAIDGYVGALGALGIWWFSGEVVRVWRLRVGLPV